VRRFRADLHIHTCLSPCGELEMSPRNIVAAATARNLEIIAICDHNSVDNAAAVMEAAVGKGLTVLPGMEVTSREEVHLITLFDGIDEALNFQVLIYDNLPGQNDPDVFGMQVIASADDEVVGFNSHFLIGATTLALAEVVARIHAHGGLAIAAHIDREAFGVIGQLGFIPANLKLDALEISARLSRKEARVRFPEYRNYPILQSSDAHTLDDVGKAVTELMLEEGTFGELSLALPGMMGRGICAI